MAKRELLATIRDRYGASSGKDKSRILDEFIAVTGHHRKHGIRLLAQPGDSSEKAGVVKGRRHLRRGGSGGGDPGMGGIGPDLRQTVESSVAPPGGVHGATRPPGSAAETREGHGGQPEQTPA